MIFCSFNILAIVAFGFCLAEKLHLPVPTCKRNITNYSSCLKHAIQEAWPLFVKGLPPEFDFPRIDPYIYKNIIGEFDNGDLHATLNGRDVTFEGAEVTRIKRATSHFSDDVFRLEADVYMPKIFVTGYVEALGTLAGFRLGGKGQVNVTLGRIRASWIMSGPVKNDTWIVEHTRMTPTLRTVIFSADNEMFDGNREITELVNMFVNEYWPQLYRVVTPIVLDIYDTHFSEEFNRLFTKLSFSEVFP